MKKRESVFYIIYEFFRTIFQKDKQILLNSGNIVDIGLQNNFKSDVKYSPIYENKDLLKVQSDYESGKIKESDLPIDTIIVLKKLYKEQINQLNQSLEKCKSEIVVLKSNLI